MPWLPVWFWVLADWSGAVAVPLPLVLPEVVLVPVWASVMPAPSSMVAANIINLRIKLILRAGESPLIGSAFRSGFGRRGVF